jgi:hypothetical protein
MCKGLLLYYPKQSWPSHHCQNYRSIPLCELMIDATVFGCHFRSFVSSLGTSNRTLIESIIRNCGQDKTCTPECLKMVSEIEMSHHHIKGTLNFKSVTSINFTDEYYIGVDLICAVVFRIFRLQLTTING